MPRSSHSPNISIVRSMLLSLKSESSLSDRRAAASSSRAAKNIFSGSPKVFSKRLFTAEPMLKLESHTQYFVLAISAPTPTYKAPPPPPH